MSRATGVILACLVVTPVTVLVALGVANRFEQNRPKPTALQPVPQPAGPPAEPAASPREPEDPPWVEAVSTRGRGWLIDGRFRYRGRYPDCWVVYEAWGHREVYSTDVGSLAQRLLQGRGNGPDEPVSGEIDVALALPVASPHCTFGVSLRWGGRGLTWYRPTPFPGYWTRSQTTEAVQVARQRIRRGYTLLVFRHTTEEPLSRFEDGHRLVRTHFEHAKRVSGLDDYHFGNRDLLEKHLDTPAAWTAARLVGAAVGPVPLLAAAPQVEFLDAYYSYARISVYLRFLSDEEVEKVRAAAASLATDPNAGRNPTRLIESFRTEPTR